MTLEEINKLKELKQLHDAGILTLEEMQAEKAKLLGTATADDDEAKEETAQETEREAGGYGPHETVQPDGLRDNNVQTEEPAAEEHGTNKILLACLLGVVIVGIIIAIAFKSSSNQSTTHYDYSTPMDSEIVVADETLYDEDSYNAEYDTEDTSGSADDSDDEFAFDPWVGQITMDGYIYRICDSHAWLSLRKTSKGMYEGTIHIMLGSGIEENMFDPYWGTLDGTIRAKANGNVLTVVLDTYTTKTEENGNFFDNSDLTGQIFRITYDGGIYTVTAVGDMEGFFGDGDVRVSK